MTNEIWQVEVGGQIYDTTFDEMISWIAERSLLPSDNVRRGNLRWIQAGKVPALKKYFGGEIPVYETVSAVGAQTLASADLFVQPPSVTENAVNDFVFQSEPTFTAKETTSCHFHEEAEARFVCKSCCNRFCKNCPKSFGTISVCPVCGEMCEPISANKSRTERQHRQTISLSGFGFEDFARAIVYPFKFKVSLVVGAIFYAFLLLGGFFGSLLANMVLFGSIAQTIGQISRGNLQRNFMPEFDNLDFWEDIIHPWFLGIGVWLVSWLPAALLILLLTLGLLNSLITAREETLEKIRKPEIEQTIDLPRTDPSQIKPRTLEEMLADDAKAGAQPSADEKTDEQEIPGTGLTDDDLTALIEGTDAVKSEAAARKFDEAARNSRKIQVERVKSDYEATFEMIKPFLKAAIPLVILFLLAVFWGILYSPIALAIAGYTGSFLSTINPLVGIDTIKRMGVGTYIKAFLMYLAVNAVYFVIAAIVAVITAPFDMPFVGNLPGRFIGSIFLFYFSLVIACILGLALYKSADKLGIEIE